MQGGQNGQDGQDGQDEQDGQDGQNGQNGQHGQDGRSADFQERHNKRKPRPFDKQFFLYCKYSYLYFKYHFSK